MVTRASSVVVVVVVVIRHVGMLLLLGVASHLSFRAGQMTATTASFCQLFPSWQHQQQQPSLSSSTTSWIHYNNRTRDSSLSSAPPQHQQLLPPMDTAARRASASSSSTTIPPNQQQQQQQPRPSLPSGYHLFVDIQNVHSNYFTSCESSLPKALLELILSFDDTAQQHQHQGHPPSSAGKKKEDGAEITSTTTTTTETGQHTTTSNDDNHGGHWKHHHDDDDDLSSSSSSSSLLSYHCHRHHCGDQSSSSSSINTNEVVVMTNADDDDTTTSSNERDVGKDSGNIMEPECSGGNDGGGRLTCVTLLSGGGHVAVHATSFPGPGTTTSTRTKMRTTKPTSPIVVGTNNNDDDDDDDDDDDRKDDGNIIGGALFLDWFLPCNDNNRQNKKDSNNHHCADDVLIRMLPAIKRLFARPATSTMASMTNTPATATATITTTANSTQRPIIMAWGHKLRGFRSDFIPPPSTSTSHGPANIYPQYQRDKNPYDQELGQDTVQRRDFTIKLPLVSYTTKFQRVDIYELQHDTLGTVYNSLGRLTTPSSLGTDPRLAPSQQQQQQQLSTDEDDNDHEKSKNIVTLPPPPDRVFFIDGVLQSSLYGEAVYHEALVHPALLAHPHPRRVAIIGGGEGATLREVLKHKTVEEAVMIELDEELANLSRRYVPEWSDCSDIPSASDDVDDEMLSCFDHPRTTMHYEDAFAFFLDEFGHDDVDNDEDTDDDRDGEENVTLDTTHNTDLLDDGEPESLFDVIIMDALDPDDFGDFVDKLYNDTDFIRSLYDGLTVNGVIVVQVGELPSHADPPDELSTFYNRAHMMVKLKEVGFQTIQTYAEGHCHFFSPWQFIVAFKSVHTSSANWFRGEAEVELKLHQRLHRTTSGKPILQYFDGCVMKHYQRPPKVVTANNCRSSEEGSEQKCSALKKSTALKLPARVLAWDGLVSPFDFRTGEDDAIGKGQQQQLGILFQQLTSGFHTHV